jgi:biotin carboxyl carrier protein
MRFTAIVNGALVEGTWEWSEGSGGGTSRTIEARVNDRVYTLEIIQVEAQVYWVRWGDRSFDVTVTDSPEGTIVTFSGHRIVVEIEGDRPQLRRASSGSEARSHDGKVELRAPMPGKIVRTLVAEGESVRANQGLVVMEAMKMQNEIRTPKAGIVTSLKVREGAPVNAGDILATVE